MKTQSIDNKKDSDGCCVSSCSDLPVSSVNVLLRKEVVGGVSVIRITCEGKGAAVLLPEDLQELSAWLADPRATWLMVAAQDRGEIIPPTVIQGWRSPQDHSSQEPPTPESRSSTSATVGSDGPASPESSVPDSVPRTIPT